ncbi:hypothetical protein [Poseidonocella sp. HB161398]|uniref:hypothetical protein n=1 Tax=Poseidonocella sp. HB161398 TaxID=2320855 RepID=UPI001108679E|nr:hypothetical protein [Poseidonocella sp. HB161398]
MASTAGTSKPTGGSFEVDAFNEYPGREVGGHYGAIFAAGLAAVDDSTFPVSWRDRDARVSGKGAPEFNVHAQHVVASGAEVLATDSDATGGAHANDDAEETASAVQPYVNARTITRHGLSCDARNAALSGDTLPNVVADAARRKTEMTPDVTIAALSDRRDLAAPAR